MKYKYINPINCNTKFYSEDLYLPLNIFCMIYICLWFLKEKNQASPNDVHKIYGY